MGSHHSKSSAQTAPADGPQPFVHPICLQGLPGSGVRTVQARARLKSTQVMKVDERFLVQPPIYANSSDGPSYSSKQVEANVWAWRDFEYIDDYGGRHGSLSPVALWSLVAARTKALVFVVDSTNRDAMTGSTTEAPLPKDYAHNYAGRRAKEQVEILETLRSRMNVRDTLRVLLGMTEFRDKPLLVLATKQDMPGAMPPAEIVALLNLPALAKHRFVDPYPLRGPGAGLAAHLNLPELPREWRLSGCNAQTGEGLEEAFLWLHHIICQQKVELEAHAWKSVGRGPVTVPSVMQGGTTTTPDGPKLFGRGPVTSSSGGPVISPPGGPAILPTSPTQTSPEQGLASPAAKSITSTESTGTLQSLTSRPVSPLSLLHHPVDASEANVDIHEIPSGHFGYRTK